MTFLLTFFNNFKHSTGNIILFVQTKNAGYTLLLGYSRGKWERTF
jgi:hypothetical protein